MKGALKLFFVAITILGIGICSVERSVAQQQQKGSITGKIIDGSTKEPMIGVNVILKGTNMGAASDFEGQFVIRGVPVGEYNLIARMIGYSDVNLEKVVVSNKLVTELQAIEMQFKAIEMGSVVVTARFIQNSEEAMLSRRKDESAISDGLSAEAISRTSSGQAADAMQQVTGASVVGGKYVYVRGLGERYASTQLNGVELPSADPDKRSFQLDLIPTAVLDNIVTTKTFTPDQPGNFSGGVVNLGMRSFPDKMMFTFSTSTSYNSVSTFNDQYLTYAGGSRAWLGMDDGTRSLPDVVKDENLTIPDESDARRDETLANEIDRVSQAFTPVMAPSQVTAPINRSIALSFGNQLSLFGKPLGFFGSLNYSRDYSLINNGQVARWKLTGNVSENDVLTNLVDLTDTKGSDEVLWGGMATTSYQFMNGQEIQLNYLLSHSGNSESRYLTGPWPEQGVSGYETRALKFTERRLSSWQLRGDHALPFGFKFNWTGFLATTKQDEPDTRYFSDTFSNRKFAGRDTVIYSISPSIISRPARYFREMDEDSKSFQFASEKDFQIWNGSEAKIKFGALYEEKQRNFEESLFEYWKGSGYRYDGDAETFLSPEKSGIIGYDQDRDVYKFGYYIQRGVSTIGGDYSGSQIVRSAFLMVDMNLFSKLRFIGGARFEASRMDVSNDEEFGMLRDDDWLPSVNLVYKMKNDMNLRLAYGRTLARPNFREKAPYANFEFSNDFIFNGNVDLKRTLIDNYDLRWDWFLSHGEIISVSGFYKYFRNPIERVINVFFSSEGALVFFDNVDNAKVYGLEFELRKNLGMFHSSLNNFMFGGNISFIHSQVAIPEEELINIRALNPDAENKRELQGQSPFVANINLTYDNAKTGTTANLFYNITGERLSEVSLGGTPNVFEQPRHLVNISATQKIWNHLSVKGSVKNLLNQSHSFIHHYQGQEFVRQEYKPGTSYSLGLKYEL